MHKEDDLIVPVRPKPITVTLQSLDDIDTPRVLTLTKDNLRYAITSLGLLIVGYGVFAWWTQSIFSGFPGAPLTEADLGGSTIIQPDAKDVSPAQAVSSVSDDDASAPTDDEQRSAPTSGTSVAASSSDRQPVRSPASPQDDTQKTTQRKSPESTPPSKLEPKPSEPQETGPVRSILQNPVRGTVELVDDTVDLL